MLRRHSVPSFHILLLVAFVVACVTPGAQAQTLYGSVVGVVTDPTGAAIPRAHVALSNSQTNLKRETDTDDAGRYTIPTLPEGAYDVAITATGFKPLTQTNVAVKVGSVGRLDS